MSLGYYAMRSSSASRCKRKGAHRRVAASIEFGWANLLRARRDTLQWAGALRLSLGVAIAHENDSPRRVDVGHQLVGMLIANIGVVAFRQVEIGCGEFLRGE